MKLTGEIRSTRGKTCPTCYRPSRVNVSRRVFPQATENTGVVIKLVRFGKYDVLSSGIIVVRNVDGLPSYSARCTQKIKQKKKN
jgi:hypothetical protein